MPLYQINPSSIIIQSKLKYLYNKKLFCVFLIHVLNSKRNVNQQCVLYISKVETSLLKSLESLTKRYRKNAEIPVRIDIKKLLLLQSVLLSMPIYMIREIIERSLALKKIERRGISNFTKN